MSAFSELSVLELDTEHGELLPNREALQALLDVKIIVEVPVIVQLALADGVTQTAQIGARIG